MQRFAGAHELLDGPLEPRELETNLRDLARLNRWLGGADLSWRALELVADRWPANGLTLLDVGTGAADIPVTLLARARSAGLSLAVQATDVRPEILVIARRRTAGVPGLTIGGSERRSLGQPERSFDVVHSSLLLHHHEPDEAIRLLREMGAVARRAVIVNDLDRSRRSWVAARLLASIATRSRYSRHDGPLSVLRAYRPRELEALAERAGLRAMRRFGHVLGYRYAIVFVPER